MGLFSCLPPEILQMIFKHVTGANVTKTMLQCRLVCKGWKSSAELVAFSTVYLKTEDQVESLLNAFRDPNSSLSPSLIQTMDLYFSYNAKLDGSFEDCLDELANTFSSVKHINILEPNDNDYNILISARPKLQQLKTLPEVSVKEYVFEHNYCAIAYRHSLTRLVLHVNRYDKNRNNYESYLEVNDVLDQFTKLQYLEIRTHDNVGVDFFDEQIQKCKNIDKFKLIAFNNDDHRFFNSSSGSSNNNDDDEEQYEEFDLNHINPRPNITELSGYFVLQNDNALNYLIDTFTHLKCLRINYSDGDCPQNSEYRQLRALSKYSSFTPDTLVKFLNYVEKIPEHIATINTNSNCIDTTISAYLENKQRQCKTTAAAFDDSIVWEITFDNSTIENTSDSTLLTIMNSPYYLSNTTTTEKPEIIGINYDMINFCAAFQKFVDKNGIYMKKLNLYMMSIRKENNTASDSMYSHCLNYVFQKCLSLKSLELLRWPNVWTKSANMESPCSYTITRMALRYADISENVIYDISKRLPSLKRFEILSCIWIKPQYRLYRDHHLEHTIMAPKQRWKVLMPFTSLDHLYIAHNCHNNVKRIIIKVKTVKLGTRFYAIELYHHSTSKHLKMAITENDYNYYVAGKEDYFNINIECASINELRISLQEDTLTFQSSFVTKRPLEFILSLLV